VRKHQATHLRQQDDQDPPWRGGNSGTTESKAQTLDHGQQRANRHPGKAVNSTLKFDIQWHFQN